MKTKRIITALVLIIVLAMSAVTNNAMTIRPEAKTEIIAVDKDTYIEDQTLEVKEPELEKYVDLNEKQKKILTYIGIPEKEFDFITADQLFKYLSEPVVFSREFMAEMGFDMEAEVKRNEDIVKNTALQLEQKGYKRDEIEYLVSKGFYLEGSFKEDYDKMNSIDTMLIDFSSSNNEIQNANSAKYTYYKVHGAVPSILSEISSYVCFNNDVDFISTNGYELHENDYGYYDRLSKLESNIYCAGEFSKKLYGLWSPIPMTGYNYNVWGEIDFGSGRHHEGVDYNKGSVLVKSPCSGWVIGRSDSTIDEAGDGISYIAVLDESQNTIIVYEHLLVSSSLVVGSYVPNKGIIGIESNISYDSSMGKHTHVEFHQTNEDHYYYLNNAYTYMYPNSGSTLESFRPYLFLLFYAYNS